MSGYRLARSTSAYLRQHADNPVEWFEWGDEAMAAARATDRPIFLSIGYAACHWCHVMAHESFEDEDTARALNDAFVAVKVDREERPDLDAIYMAATLAVSGHGGWPMSVFLTPDGRPFMAGTYYPPLPRHGQPSFTQLLAAIDEAWRTRRGEVIEQANELAAAMISDTRFIDRVTPRAPMRRWREVTSALVQDLVARVDDDGGFGDAPKFPRASYVEALLVHWSDERARAAATTTLNAMSREGLFDHLHGGFARYSVDAQWHVPHFEKMLSDQALLAATYLRADRCAGGTTPWRDVALATLRFVTAELAVADGLASSLDADAGGHEGSHVTWTVDEVRRVLSDADQADHVPAVLARWRISDPGAFEGRSIPRLAPGEPFRPPDELAPAFDALRAARATRPQPGRDDKVVLEFNAMFVVAAMESRDDALESFARELLRRLHVSHFDAQHWWRTESRRARATAGDIGWLIAAHVSVYERDGDDAALAPVDELVTYLVEHFWDGPVPRAGAPEVGGGIFTTDVDVTDIVHRPKEIFDDATPSSHAVCAAALARVGLVRGDDGLLTLAQRLVDLAGPLLDEHPSAVPELVRAYGFLDERRELVVPGEPGPLGDLLRSFFVPSSVIVSGSGSSPLLRDRQSGWAYVCRASVCALPVNSTADLVDQLTALVAP